MEGWDSSAALPGHRSPRAAFAHLCQFAQLMLVLRVKSHMAFTLWML